jgi:hypothetical protein
MFLTTCLAGGQIFQRVGSKGLRDQAYSQQLQAEVCRINSTPYYATCPGADEFNRDRNVQLKFALKILARSFHTASLPAPQMQRVCHQSA